MLLMLAGSGDGKLPFDFIGNGAPRASEPFLKDTGQLGALKNSHDDSIKESKNVPMLKGF